MSPQTETKASVGFKAGVKEYKLTYYTPEYETKKFFALQQRQTDKRLIRSSPPHLLPKHKQTPKFPEKSDHSFINLVFFNLR
jgi:hypothetical protein